MRYFPIFLDLGNQTVLVVGGGEAALQKLRLLCRTPADIHVVAMAPCPGIEALAETHAVRLSRRAFATRDIVGCRLAFAATGDAAELAHVAAAARAAAVPLNAVDRPLLCDFLTPAIVDRDPLVVAIGSEGAAPVLARLTKARIEALLPARLGALARFAQGLRSRVAAALPAGRVRRRFWDLFFSGETARRFLAGDVRGAEAAILRVVEEAAGMSTAPGRVSLVGAGPGDPDLLTFRALQALQSADVIVVDREVDRRVLEVARRDARRIEVGKTPGSPSTEQALVHGILLREARAGHHVVRLAGGDPFLFGRGREELAALRDAGIEVEVVPGISAASAWAARELRAEAEPRPGSAVSARGSLMETAA
jgi:uroporphyrin-III C-methyltransferase/precorrin-2 dehydrogenase/sirohydrochlorin ferrochelatase